MSIQFSTNSDLIKKILRLEIKFEEIREECFQFIDKFPFERNQVCLNDRNISREFDAYEGIGTAYDFEQNTFRFHEHQFTRWAPDLAGSQLIKAFTELTKLGFKIGRTRLMLLKGRSCYSFHSDVSQRIHLVLKASDHAAMIFPPNDVIQVPLDGHFYLTNTTLPHTAMNGSLEDRIHLVLALHENTEVLDIG